MTSDETEQRAVSLPRDLAHDVHREFNGVLENRGGPNAPEELKDAGSIVQAAIADSNEGDRVEIPRDALETAAEWLKADVDDHIERYGDRPPTGIDSYRRLEARLGDTVESFSDTIIASTDWESVITDARRSVRSGGGLR